MAIVTREQLLNAVFTDAKNFPYGFARSGDFSISESKALSQYGRLIFALVNGTIAATCAEDDAFIAVANGNKEPETDAERAWCKYQSRINRPKAGSIYGSNKPVESSRTVRSADDGDIISETEDVVIEEGE